MVAKANLESQNARFDAVDYCYSDITLGLWGELRKVVQFSCIEPQAARAVWLSTLFGFKRAGSSKGCDWRALLATSCLQTCKLFAIHARVRSSWKPKPFAQVWMLESSCDWPTSSSWGRSQVNQCLRVPKQRLPLLDAQVRWVENIQWYIE